MIILVVITVMNNCKKCYPNIKQVVKAKRKRYRDSSLISAIFDCEVCGGLYLRNESHYPNEKRIRRKLAKLEDIRWRKNNGKVRRYWMEEE